MSIDPKIKILVISYHSLPMDVIASYRAMAYLKHFKKYGIEPTLLTHHWASPAENRTVTAEHFPYGTVLRVPVKNHWLHKWTGYLEEISGLNKMLILARWVSGIFDPTPIDRDSYQSLRSFCFSHLRETRYDLLLGIFSPHHHLRLCFELHQRFGIPYVLDFRDLWNNRVIHKQYQPTVTERIQDSITRYYWKKWLKQSLFFSITSQEWMEKIHEFSEAKGVVIHNGYDPEQFQQVQVDQASSEFVILHAGTLYAHQKLEIFLEGCRQFIEKARPERFRVKFIGADRHVRPARLSGYLSGAKNHIRSFLNPSVCEVSKRIPKTELASEFIQCQLLLFPGLPDSPGTHLGKIFDYLGSGKNILLVPDDHSVVGELIRETNTGFIANTPEEVCRVLISCYREWKQNGEVKYRGRPEVIRQYTRESQVRKMAEVIRAFLKDEK